MCKNVPFPRYNQKTSTSHVELPTSAAYCTLLFFWVHLQEGLDVTTSYFNTYTVPTYHVVQHPSQPWSVRAGLPLNPQGYCKPRLPKYLIQLTSNHTSKMRWCTIVLKPCVLMHMQWHIFHEPMQYVFKKIHVCVTSEIRWKNYGPITHPSRNAAHMLKLMHY